MTDPETRLEDGNALYRPNTDDPSDYPSRSPVSPDNDWNKHHEPRHATTMPANSRRKDVHEPADRIGADVPFTSSPPPSIRGPPPQEDTYNEKTIESRDGERSDSDKTKTAEETKDTEDGKKHGLRGLLQGRTTHKKEEMDDDNGKAKKKKKFTPMSQLQATLFNSWINVLLIACTCSYTYTHDNSNVI